VSASTDDVQAPEASTVDVASMSWAFTQHHPLDTTHLIDEAKRRGLDLDLPTLRELYRLKLLMPFVYLNDRQVGPVPVPIADEPPPGGTFQIQLRHARDRGRLSDPASAPFRPRLPFDLPSGRDRQRWWNGMLYSWYQLLICPEIAGLLSYRKRSRTAHGKLRVRLPSPHSILVAQAGRLHRIAVVLTAIEARYFPKLDPEWLHLNNAEVHQWRRYRAGFDPAAVSAQLGYSATDTRRDGEWLLTCAHRLDPVGDSWSQLMRRAPSTAWKNLKDAALSALDYRIAAEILLLFYDDLADRGQAAPLPDLAEMRMSWHPLHERLSSGRRTLDEDLMRLGISPHPRVILAVEGETEQVHVPLVWKDLGYPDAPELMRLLMLGGVDRDLEKVAALAAAPLVGQKVPGPRPAWQLIKPPSRLLIAVDPEGRYFAPGKVTRTQAAILNEIKAVLKAQGVANANPSELEELVEIRTWSERCYEYAHFTDDELAEGITQVHTTINGLTRSQLIAAIATERARGKDIKEVWSQWAHKPGKPKLAEALWPTLRAKIDRCRVDTNAPVPPIVEVVQDVYHVAQRWRYLTFVLSEAPENSGTSA
jgi:hypothetical protein